MLLINSHKALSLNLYAREYFFLGSIYPRGGLLCHGISTYFVLVIPWFFVCLFGFQRGSTSSYPRQQLWEASEHLSFFHLKHHVSVSTIAWLCISKVTPKAAGSRGRLEIRMASLLTHWLGLHHISHHWLWKRLSEPVLLMKIQMSLLPCL